MLEPRPLCAFVVALGLFAAPASWAAGTRRIEIATAKTWAGLARVVLSVDRLAVIGGYLEGDYQIRVPLAPFMNDRGKVRLELREGLDSTLERGGTLAGTSFSTDGGPTRTIDCSVEPGGDVEIRVATPDRTLLFKSRIKKSS